MPITGNGLIEEVGNMYAQVERTKESKIRAVANSVVRKKGSGKHGFGFVDNRSEAVAQRKLQERANNNSAQQQQPIQKKENNTGLSDNLKTGMENLSGISLEDVKVHYNSDKPARFTAHAYAQAADIRVASRLEKKRGAEVMPVQLRKINDVVFTNDDQKEKFIGGYLAWVYDILVGENTKYEEVLELVSQREKNPEMNILIEENVFGENSECILPDFYIPTNIKVWKEFIQRVRNRDSLKIPARGKDVSQDLNVETEKGRADSLKFVSGKEKQNIEELGWLKGMKTVDKEKLEQLVSEIDKAKLTMNFSLDKLFKYTCPQILNAMQAMKIFQIKTNNTSDETLIKQRLAQEETLFGIAQNESNTRIRPLYAALNVGGSKYGASARNDYGMSYFILSDALKQKCTITLGDSFNASQALPYKKENIKTLIEIGVSNGELSLDYDPNKYIEVQIHDDVDIRKHVEHIMVSMLEAKIFDIRIETIIDLVKKLTDNSFVYMGQM